MKLISCIRRNDLDRREFEYFVFTFTAIAIEMGDAIQLKEAKNLLENLNVSSPYFNNRRLELLVHVQDTMEKGRSVSIVNATRTILAGMARSARRYLILQPNFMGFGINVNSIIDDLAKETHAKSISEDEGSLTKNTER